MNPMRIGPLLDVVTKKMGMATKLRAGLAVEIWPKVVGAELASQTQAGPLKQGMLIVRTPNPVLAHQLCLMEKEILYRFRKILGKRVVVRLMIQIGAISDQENPEAAETKEEPRELTAVEIKQWSKMAENIPDQAVAEAFLRAAKAWARRKTPGNDGEDNFKQLMLGDTWPTADEISLAEMEVPDYRLPEIRRQVEEALRKKIVVHLQRGPGGPDWTLSVRGDLRRLALLRNYPLNRNAESMLADLIGPESGQCPKKDGNKRR